MASSKLARRRQGGSLPKESPIMESLTTNDPNAGAGGVVTKDKFHNISRSFKLDDVEMIKTIGTGTFARVYLCRPKAHLNRYVLILIRELYFVSNTYAKTQCRNVHIRDRVSIIFHVKTHNCLLCVLQLYIIKKNFFLTCPRNK